MIVDEVVGLLGSSRPPEGVESLALFGSCCRGDADAISDVDVAAFTAGRTHHELTAAKEALSAAVPGASFSVYSQFTAEQMAADGSLFLWHLKIEGRVLWSRSRWTETLLERLRPYSVAKAHRDLDNFDLVLKDVLQNIEADDSLLLYERSTLYSVLRSIGMIASVRDGCATFRRTEPIRYVISLARGRLSIGEREIDSLMAARHTYARNAPGEPVLDKTATLRLAHQAILASKLVREHVGRALY